MNRPSPPGICARKMPLAGGYLVFLLSVLSCAMPAAAVTDDTGHACPLEGMRFSHQPSHTRLVLDVSAALAYRFNENGNSAVLTLTDIPCEKPPWQIDLRGTYVEDPGWSDDGAGSTAVHMHLRARVPARFRHFSLAPSGSRAHRIVIDVLPENEEGAAGRRSVVIAVDAGHGGHDSGAISVIGYAEKDLVLKIARALVLVLNNKPGFKGVLLRSDDRYLSLEQRVQRARLASADVFLSIHGDSYGDARVQGVSVYALSANAASGVISHHLAGTDRESESIADPPSSIESAAGEDTLNYLPNVVANLSMRFALARSVKMGDHLLRALGEVATVHRSQVKQAGFVVLKPIDVPSLLVEVGFLSNPEEARRLRTPEYQRKIVTALASGLETYLRAEPPVGSYFASATAR